MEKFEPEGCTHGFFIARTIPIHTVPIIKDRKDAIARPSEHCKKRVCKAQEKRKNSTEECSHETSIKQKGLLLIYFIFLFVSQEKPANIRVATSVGSRNNAFQKIAP